MLCPGNYTPTPMDLLWLHRAVAAEGEPKRAVAQALVNRFMFLRSDRPGLYPTLAGFVRAYAQPVNPRWQPGGDKYEESLERADEHRATELRQRAQRRRVASSRTEFDASTVEAVDRALREGPVDLPTPATTDYASPSLQAGSGFIAVSDPTPGQNRFYEVDSSWPGYSVTTTRRLAPMAVGLALVTLVVLAKGPKS